MEAECFVPRPGSCRVTARAGPLDGSAGEEVKQASTLTYAQKKKMQRAQRVEAGELDSESEVLDPQYAEAHRSTLTESERKWVSPERQRTAHQEWMSKLAKRGLFRSPARSQSLFSDARSWG